MLKTDKISINVRNLGPIGSAKFDLRPLTVFTGKNNTGKSWLASFVYAIFSYSSSTNFQKFVREREHSLFEKNHLTKFVENPERWIKQLQHEKTIELNDEELDLISEQVDLTRHASVIASEIFRCSRSAKRGELIRSNSDSEAFLLVQRYVGGLENPPNQFLLDARNSKTKFNIPLRHVISLEKTESRYYARILRSLFRIREDDERHHTKRYLFFELLRLIESQGHLSSGRALYIPAERVGLTNNYRTFVSSVLQENIDSNLLQASGVNLDFVKKLLDIPKDDDSRFLSTEASNLERKLIKGKIKVEHDWLNIPQFFYEYGKLSEKLPLNMSSSMVSQIAPIVLFLRYYGWSHKTLIVEEPEAHLHPEKQVSFIQEICRWIREGYHVVLTTHSEWIMEGLSNEVLLNDIDQARGLNHSQIGVWEVKEGRKGSVVKETKWKRDEMGYDDGFDRVADKLSNHWFECHGRLP